MASAVYLTLQAENASLKMPNANGNQSTNGNRNQKKRKNNKGGKGKGKKGKGKQKRQNQGNRTAEPPEQRTQKYCHAHGTQPSHTSAEYKLMAGDTATFNAAMRNAKDSDHPPGGCTRVNGQDQWAKQAMTAHCAVTASENPLQKSVVFSDDEYDFCSETEEFLAIFVWESLSTNDKAYLEPNGDPNSSSAQMACNDGYLPEDGEPVQITAQMVTDDLLFESETNSTTHNISSAPERSESSSVATNPSMHPNEIPLSYTEASRKT